MDCLSSFIGVGFVFLLCDDLDLFFNFIRGIFFLLKGNVCGSFGRLVLE